MLFDTHCHLTDQAFAGDLDGILARAAEAKVTGILCVAVDLTNAEACRELAKTHPHVRWAAGIHPELAAQAAPDWEERLDELLSRTRPAAVGEIGLDGHHPIPPLAEQMPVFRKQVRLAAKHRLPMVIHSRKASWECLKVIEEEGASEAGGVFHCIEGDEVFARAAVNLGFHLGVGGTATFPRNDVLRAMIKRMPVEKILLETDAPYLAPHPMRGKRNEPAFVARTAEVLAGAVGLSVAEFAAQTTANAERLFHGR